MPTTITTGNRLPPVGTGGVATYGFIGFGGKTLVFAALAVAVLLIGATAYLEPRTFLDTFDPSIAAF